LHWFYWDGESLIFRCPVTFDREDNKCDSETKSTWGLNGSNITVIQPFILYLLMLNEHAASIQQTVSKTWL